MGDPARSTAYLSIMPQAHQLIPIELSDATQLDRVEEHRRVFGLRDCQLSIFETYNKCPDVALSSQGLVISSMMRGRKVLSQPAGEHFDFVPGESVIIPDGISMRVDFPEADAHHPVQCANLALEWGMVERNLAFLNEQYPNTEAPFTWKLDFSRYHFQNNRELASSINRLISISMEDSSAKDALADLSLKFLLLRIIQTQNLALLLQPAPAQEFQFAGVVEHIRQHLQNPIAVDELARVAGMSKPLFYRDFKAFSGTTPLEFVVRERIALSKQRLADPAISVSEACYSSGFNNLNYFIRQFKRIEGITPKAFQQM